MSGLSGKGYSRTLLLSVVMLGIIAISVILVSALQASSQGARLVIELPPGHEILNTSPQNVSLYYAELWAVVPDGLLVVKKGFLNPLRPVIEVTPADLINATSKWLEIYTKKGKQVKPSILIQVSTYSEKENRTALAFGASVIYDPEEFTPGKVGATVSHKILKKDFPEIKIREVKRSKDTGGSGYSLSPACSSESISSSALQSGLPGTGLCESPFQCDCCERIYSRLVTTNLIFDSNNPELPSVLRGRVPLIIAHLDPYSAATRVLVTYKAQNVPSIEFRISIIDVYEKRLAFGSSSLQASGTVGNGMVIKYKGYYGLIYFPGTYKVYEAYEYTCCDFKGCGGNYYTYCEPACADQTCGKYVLVIVTYAEPNNLGGVDDIPPDSMGIDISTIRQYISFSYHGSINPGSYLTISRDPYEIRVNPLEIASLIMLRSPDVASTIADIVGFIVTPTIIFRSSNTVEAIEIYSEGGTSYVYIASVIAYYQGSSNSYRPLIIDIR